MSVNASAPGSLVSIAVAERETGLGKDTLRVWERRYGFPRPQRDAHGDRLYPRDQISRLRLMKRLLDNGHRPGRIVAASDAELQELSDGTLPSANLPYELENTVAHDPAVAELPLDNELAALKRHDAMAFRTLLSQQLARIGLERFVTELLPRLNILVGDAWAAGELAVFEEHFYTEQVKALLIQAINNLPTGTRRPRVLLTTVPGELHRLGVLMVEALLALRGVSTLSLGAQTPLHDIAAASRAHSVDVVALSFSAAFPSRQLAPVIGELRALLPETVQIWIGGMGALGFQQPLPRVERLTSLTAMGSLLDRA
jgi:MerR family transcriptional regulator, light-induced transcriptional regulator